MPRRLFLTSATVLFVELLLIRWIPANVVYVGFFSNFLLLGSFLGIGAGILVGRRWTPRVSPFPLLALGVVLLVTRARLDVQVRSSDEIFFGLGSESGAADSHFFVLPAVVALTTLVLASAALPLGRLLVSLPPLRAYAIDIAGALVGIGVFTALAAGSTPPRVWFAVLGVAVVAYELAAGSRLRAGTAAAAFAAIVALAGDRPAPGVEVRWSPYYRLSLAKDASRIDANGIPHQFMVPAAQALGRGPRFYAQIYRWFPERTFDDVLVIGAGSGTDTAVALARGASHVDAVEIDPAIADFGRRFHPDRPYASDRVDVHVTDGRSWLRSTDRKYDLVVFALPDSLVLLTNANLRLESFLFTEEAFRAARARLKPGGVFVLYNFYRQRWLVERIGAMLERTFDAPPLVRLGSQGGLAVLADGPAVEALHGAPPPGDHVDPLDLDRAPRPATDDWPFPYLREPGIPGHYLVALAILLAFAAALVAVACRVSQIPLARGSPHFFVLGAAFMLLETRSLVCFDLLFGATWTVNALASFAVLTTVLLAIGVAAKAGARARRVPWVALFVALAVAYALPPEALLFEPRGLRYVLAGALAFAPVFLANIVFARSFGDAKAADVAFASNMLGAACGGALEYLSLWLGTRALLAVAAALYVAAWLFTTRLRVLGDRADAKPS